MNGGHRVAIFSMCACLNIISGIECIETEHAAKMDASKEIRQSRMSVSKEERSADLNAGARSETDGGSSLNDSLDSKAPSSSTEPSTPFGDDPIKSIDECCEQVGEQHGLTPREREIFAMLAKGRNGRFIMEHYVISRNTVKSHIKHIYSNRRAFAAGAYRHGGKRARITLEPPVAQAPFAYVLMPFVLIYRPGL